MTLPPGPATPTLIQTIDAIFNATGRLERLSRRYGDPFSSRVGDARPSVIFGNPQAIQAVLTADPEIFLSGAANRILQPLLGASSLLLLDGPTHARHRKLMTPPFHGERVRAYAHTIRATALAVLGRRTGAQSFSLHEAMQEITLTVILRTLFGELPEERRAPLAAVTAAALNDIGSLLGVVLLFFPALQRDLGASSPWGRFLRQRDALDRLLYAEIHHRRTHAEPGDDILGLLLAARDEAGEPLSDREVRDELVTLLVAGHETTATALTWAFYWICARPEVRERLVGELDALGPEPDPSAIAPLPYLGAVCSETLRIYPVGAFTFPRVLKVPFELMGYQLPAGTRLMPCIYLAHHREETFPEPKRFRPERFLERQFSPYEYLPFGGANRRCLGLAFALYEMKLVIATVLEAFTLDLPDTRLPPIARRSVTFAPGRNLKMTARTRRPVPRLAGTR